MKKTLAMMVAAIGAIAATGAGAQTATATGTYNGHTYSYYNTAVNFANANGLAAGLGGYLATVTSQGEQDFLHSLTTATAYIGGSDAAVEGTWRWVGGPEAGQSFYSTSGASVDLAYSFWNGGEPNNANGNENALLINWDSGSGRWNDINASSNYGYIVEFGGMSSAVPEPASWALMMVGFGLIGAGLRRRQAVAAIA